MTGLLEGFEHLDHDRSLGGTYLPDVPWRFVTHTTEAVPSTVAGARSMAKRHPYPPHLWVWPEKDWRAQTVLLSRSAFALLHPRGTPETNRMRAIQVEIIGYAKDSPHKDDAWWRWLGEKVLAPVIAAGYPINLGHVAPLTGSDGYGSRGTVRMTRSAWRHFDGVCAHSNVPDNAHWDIGDGRLDLVAAAARTPHTEENDPMAADPRGTARICMREYLGRSPASYSELDFHAGQIELVGLNAYIEWLEQQDEAQTWADRIGAEVRAPDRD